MEVAALSVGFNNWLGFILCRPGSQPKKTYRLWESSLRLGVNCQSLLGLLYLEQLNALLWT